MVPIYQVDGCTDGSRINGLWINNDGSCDRHFLCTILTTATKNRHFDDVVTHIVISIIVVIQVVECNL